MLGEYSLDRKRGVYHRQFAKLSDSQRASHRLSHAHICSFLLLSRVAHPKERIWRCRRQSKWIATFFHLTCAITPRVLPFTGVLPSNILSRKDSKSLTHLAMDIDRASRILIPEGFFDVVSGVLNLYWDLQMCSYHGGNRRFQSTQEQYSRRSSECSVLVKLHTNTL